MPIYKDKNGTYTFRIYVKENGHSKQYQRRGFKTKHECQEAMRLFEPFKEYNESYKSIKFNDKIEEFFAECSKQMKITTLDGYKYAYNAHFSEFFRNMYISTIEPKTLLKWQNQLIAKGLTPQRCNVCLTLIKMIFQFYCDFYNLPKNPTSQLKTLKDDSIKENKERVIDRKSFTAFLDSFDPEEENLRLAFEIMYKTGLRLSEARALTWSDIDFNTHVIRINKQVQYTSAGVLVSNPKSKTSIRDVNLCKSLEVSLINYKEVIQKCYKCDISNLYILGGMKPLGATNIDRAREKHIIKANVHHFTNHELRHSYGSNLIHDGFDIKYVSTQMGHNSMRVTLEVYHHLLSDTAASNKAKYYDNY